MKRFLVTLLFLLPLTVIPQSEWHTNVYYVCNPDGTNTQAVTNYWTFNHRFQYTGDTNVWLTIYANVQPSPTNDFYVYDPTNITIITTRLPKVIQNTNNNTWKIRFP